jgi:hypothetical protein
LAAAQSLPDGVDEARAEITHLYADLLSGDSGASEVSKLFDTTDFGYREIRVERPLKLNFQVDDERVARRHRAGLIELPAPSRGNGNGRGLMHGPDVWPEAEAVAGTVGQLSGLRLEAVQDKPASRLWNGLIERYHFDQEMIGRGRRGRLPASLLVNVGGHAGGKQPWLASRPGDRLAGRGLIS